MNRRYGLVEMLLIGLVAAFAGGAFGAIVASDYDNHIIRRHEQTYHAPQVGVETRGGVPLDPEEREAAAPCDIGPLMDGNPEGTVIYVVTCKAAP